MSNNVLKKEQGPTQSSPRRYLSLWFPYLSFERCPSSTASRDIPSVLIEKQHGALRLASGDARAHDMGLKPGMSLAEARAIIPQLHAAPMNREADQTALSKLASLCDRFTPLVALDGTDGLLLDVTGCTHLHGSEAAMQQHIASFLAKRNLTVKQALAGTPDCAHALARFSNTTNVTPRDEARAVAALPVKALACCTETSLALIRAGLKTIGDVAARPSQLLTSRFGATLTTKLRRILGQEDTRLTPLRPAPDLVVEQLFPEPLQNLDMVQVSLIKLIAQLCLQLEKADKGGRSFEASFFRADGATRRLMVETAQALREPKALARLFALRLETLADPLNPGFGFDALRLGVLRSEALSQVQRQFDGKSDDEKDEDDLINRLVIRFGQSKILRFVAQDSHDPSRCSLALPISTPASAVSFLVGDQSLPRPSQLFFPPRPIEAMAEVPDGPPQQFRWRKILHQVRAAEGPERIESEWWRGGPKALRDYYRVEDKDGARFWIFREGLFTSTNPPPRWFVHGLFP